MRREIEQIESENNLMETQMRNFLLLENELIKLIVIKNNINLKLKLKLKLKYRIN